jgi:hypothetical protein
MLPQRQAQIWAWVFFLPYALLDFWQVASFVILGPAIISPDLYIWTDPSIYLPLVMGVILVFYGLLVKQLWDMPLRVLSPAKAKRHEAEAVVLTEQSSSS